ncbi:glycine zipper domain-containing protein [Thioalkalivibrio sp. ALE16]|uniref:glycine zipper 2TM domain-containing protein n=1 Tax=Thioalkalivibrio sp. ALE16 TaxID=1158172 RepID=UPI0003739DDD|nr:glycine zipper domain-containing protein [Thioalkalivibrio sp. ALE16]
MKYMKMMAVVVLVVLVVGCATSPIGSGDYPIRDARTTGDVQNGTVVAIREVRVHEENRRTGNRGAVGATVGGIAGAALGSNVSNGTGRRIAQVAGAGIGAAAGARVDQRMAQQTGVELQVELETGRNVVVTQGADQAFQVGQAVRLIHHSGTYRVTQ